MSSLWPSVVVQAEVVMITYRLNLFCTSADLEQLWEMNDFCFLTIMKTKCTNQEHCWVASKSGTQLFLRKNMKPPIPLNLVTKAQRFELVLLGTWQLNSL